MPKVISAESFSCYSLNNHPCGAAVSRILAGAIRAVDPEEAVRRHLWRDGNLLGLGVGDDRMVIDLDAFERILVFGVGKAAPAMAQTMAELLWGRTLHGLLVVKHSAEPPPVGFEQVTGGHPIPNEGSLLAGQKIAEFLHGCTAGDLLICLISGGGSALMTLPVPGVSLDDMQGLTAALLSCGARIDEINTLRRHLDLLKGGGIARMAFPAQVISLILSDVVGNPLETIASGPTAADPSTLADAHGILEKYALAPVVPASIVQALNRGRETLKPGEPVFEKVKNILVGNNLLSAQAAMLQAKEEGFHTHFLGDSWQGEARFVAGALIQVLRQTLQTEGADGRPLCLIAGGETTVTLRGKGRGGRNQELALAGVGLISEISDGMLVTLATDGEDGPTDAAGAVVTSDTFARGAALGLSSTGYLEENNAYAYFASLQDLLKTGPTGTNVNDLSFLFAF